MATKPIFDDVAPWPEQKAVPAPRNHNRPPPEEIIPLEFREALLSERPDFLQKLDDLLGRPASDDDEATEGAVHRAFCKDDDSLAKCASLVATLRACEKHVDGVHKEVKEPYLTAGRLVDGQKNVLVQRIITGRQIVEGLQQTYARQRQREEAERRAREEEERRRLEELARENDLEAALPPSPAPEPVKSAPIRSDDGATVSLGTAWFSKVDDYKTAARAVLDDVKVRGAIDAAIQRLVKAGKREIKGVTIYEDTKVNNR